MNASMCGNMDICAHYVLDICVYVYTYIYIYVHVCVHTPVCTAQGGGGSFKDRKPIGA